MIVLEGFDVLSANVEVGKRVIGFIVGCVFFCFGFVFHHCCLVWFFLFFVCKFLLCIHFEDSLQFLFFLWSTSSVEKGARWGVFLFFRFPCFHVLGLVFASLPKYDSSLFSLLLFVFASSVLFCQVLC